MTEAEALAEFEAAGALLKGHFILFSGLHSDTYLQCARVMMDARRGERLCAALAQKLRAAGLGPFDMIVSPATGGIVVGYEMGRQLGVPAVFFERVEGVFTLRRGFEISPGARCLMVEDVVTTGASSIECIAAAREQGGDVVAAASLVNRSGGRADLSLPLVSLLTIDVPAYPEHALPDALKAIPPMKPGSRGLKQK
ncbi:MAG: orotate phosphoribosyltransferase [Hyphomicrobiales bacterium]|nr:orotate phosphoribosyltransferase [Hyphomicrobiales bacterium]